MKFFSNEAKESDDDRERGDVVTSDPVSVPQQRAGSPWNDTPGEPEHKDEPAEGERQEPTDAWGHAQPATTTYGPDGTVTESDAAKSDDEVRDDEFRGDAEARDDAEVTDEAKEEALKDEGTFDSPEAVDPVTGESLNERDESTDSVADDRLNSDTDAPDADTTHADTTDSDTTDSDTSHSDTSDSETSEEAAVEPQAHPESTLDSTVTDASADTSADTLAGDKTEDSDSDRTSTEEAAADEAAEHQAKADEEQDAAVTHEPAPYQSASYEPERIDPTTGETFDKTADEPFEPVPVAVVGAPVTTDSETTDSETDRESEPVVDGATVDAAPVVAAVPVDTSAASAPATPVESLPDRLFTDGDSFLERFREIQLGFVDTPKESASQAASLVAEAVGSFTSALNERKDALAANSEDTEQLRVELRGYRDLLNRITGL